MIQMYCVFACTPSQNMEQISEALHEARMPREEVFITSKVSPYEMGPKTEAAVQQILQHLQTSYVVSYVHYQAVVEQMHSTWQWPPAGGRHAAGACSPHGGGGMHASGGQWSTAYACFCKGRC